MEQTEFLGHLFGSEKGLVCLAQVGLGGEMLRKWVKYPSPSAYLDPEWPYILPAIFDEKEGEGRTRVVAANVDEAENVPQHIAPSIWVHTSPDRLDLYWRLNEEVSFKEARVLAQRVAPAADPAPYMRLPGLVNEKYAKPFTVEVSRAPLTSYSTSVLRKLPEPNGTAVKALADWNWEPHGIGPKEFVRTLIDGDHAPSALARHLTNATSFKAALDIIAGLEIDDGPKVYLLKNAAGNPYKDSPTVGRESAKLYARHLANHNTAYHPLLEEIDRLRRSRNGPAFVRKNKITALATRELNQNGTFHHDIDNNCWYIERETGQAITLSAHSEKFRHLITRRLGVNPVDQEHRHIVEELIAKVSHQPQTSVPADLAWYDPNAGAVTIGLGGSKCMRLTAGGIDFVENGENGLIFKIPPRFEPVPYELIDLDGDYTGWWKDFWPGMPNLIGMTEAEASALLYTWTVFFFFQSAASDRPLLVWLGQFASGKSTMARNLYRLLYGVQMELISIRTQNAFDTALSNHAIAFFDNVDTKTPWLNESLATAISRTENDKRKLYSDNDLFVVQNRALVGITSRNPPFLQEDIIDRMLYFTLLRFEDLKIELIPGKDIYAKTTANRHRYFSGLLQDVRKVLATPKPGVSGITWRIADFVDLGYWIASALGIDKPFISGLERLKKQQQGLTLEVDQALVTGLQTFAARCKDTHRWRSSTELWEDLLLFAGEDVESALRDKYKSGASFSKKLFSIAGLVKGVVPIEYEMNNETGFRQWRIKEED